MLKRLQSNPQWNSYIDIGYYLTFWFVIKVLYCNYEIQDHPRLFNILYIFHIVFLIFYVPCNIIYLYLHISIFYPYTYLLKYTNLLIKI